MATYLTAFGPEAIHVLHAQNSTYLNCKLYFDMLVLHLRKAERADELTSSSIKGMHDILCRMANALRKCKKEWAEKYVDQIGLYYWGPIVKYKE